MPDTTGGEALRPDAILATIIPSGAKRTPQRAVAIITALQAGATKRAAAAHGGIDDNTLYRWIAEDEAFATLVEQAQGEAEMAYTMTVYRGAQTDPKVAMWWLERRRPRDYGRRDRMEMSYEMKDLAKSVAEEHGLDEAELLAETEAVLTLHRERQRRSEG